MEEKKEKTVEEREKELANEVMRNFDKKFAEQIRDNKKKSAERTVVEHKLEEMKEPKEPEKTPEQQELEKADRAIYDMDWNQRKIIRRLKNVEKSVRDLHTGQIAIANALREIWQVLIMKTEWDSEQLDVFQDWIETMQENSKTAEKETDEE
jgi:hypothetical protein